jgi:hypothetical protein
MDSSPARRSGFIWGQGTVFSGVMGYCEMTGEPRALAAAERLGRLVAKLPRQRRPSRRQLLRRPGQILSRRRHRRARWQRRPRTDQPTNTTILQSTNGVFQVRDNFSVITNAQRFLRLKVLVP